MREQLQFNPEVGTETAGVMGRVTVLEALSVEEPEDIFAPDLSRISTPMGNGVDAEDD